MLRAVAGMAAVLAVLAVGAGELQAQYAIGVSAVVTEQVSAGAADVRLTMHGGNLRATAAPAAPAAPAVSGAHPTAPTRLLEHTFVSGDVPGAVVSPDPGAPVWRRHHTGFTLTVESRSIHVPATATAPRVIEVTRIIASNS